MRSSIIFSPQLLVSSPRAIDGYASGDKSCFVEAENRVFYATGDVCELETNAVDGKQRVQVIDRVSAMVKDQCGKWFSPQEVESVFEHSKKILECFCFLKNSCCAVVVVSVEPKELLWKEIQSLVGFLPKRDYAFFVTPNRFSVEAGLLTPTLKKKRKALALFFEDSAFEKIGDTDVCHDEAFMRKVREAVNVPNISSLSSLQVRPF